MKLKQKGFTLVELVVVMAIIAILVALALFAINAARQQARNAERRNTVQTFKVAAEAYFATAKAYPTGSTNPYTMLTGTGVLATYSGGFSGTDPSAEPTRLCYAQNGNAKYFLRLRPEGAAAPVAASCTAVQGGDEAYDVN